MPEPYEGKTIPEIYRLRDGSARLHDFNACFLRIEDSRVTRSRKPLNETDTELTWETPVGRQTAIHRRLRSSPNTLHVQWGVESEDELKVATWREENTAWEWIRHATRNCFPNPGTWARLQYSCPA